MNKKIFVLMALILIASLTFANAEVMVKGFNGVVGTNQTKNTLYITLQDTSTIGSAKQTANNISIYINHYVNYTLANGKVVTTCLYKSQQTSNYYDIDGKLVNSTTLIDTTIYNYSATSIQYYQLKDGDILQVDLDCFWDTAIDDTIFQDLSQSIVGLGANSYAFACEECARESYQEIITDYLEAEQTKSNYLKIYLDFTNFSTAITEFWLVIYWVVRIFLLILLIGLVFGAGWWIYTTLRDIARRM